MKAMTTLPILMTIMIFSTLSSSANINFQTVDIESVLERAKESEKFIFVEFSAEQCGPCVWMENNVFTDPQVARFINVNFISVKSNGISVTSKFEKFKYNIQMLPTVLFLNSKGEEIVRIEGKTDAVNLEDVARLVVEGNTEELKKYAPVKKEDRIDPLKDEKDFPYFPRKYSVKDILMRKVEL